MVNGLDDIPGQLLLIQEVAGRLLEGVGAVEVSPPGNEQVHDVRVTVGCRYVEGAGGYKDNRSVRGLSCTTYKHTCLLIHFLPFSP